MGNMYGFIGIKAEKEGITHHHYIPILILFVLLI